MANTVARNKQNTGYTQVKNDFLRDPTISLKAKGMLALWLSHSAEWILNHKSEVKNHCKESKDSYYATVNELKKAGYVLYHVEKDERGRIIKHVYDYSDVRLADPHPGTPEVDKADTKKNNGKKNKLSLSTSSRPGTKKGKGRYEKESTIRTSDGRLIYTFRPKNWIVDKQPASVVVKPPRVPAAGESGMVLRRFTDTNSSQPSPP